MDIKRYTVLIVEDSPEDRATYRRLTFGRFEMTPIRGGALRTITEQLVKQIDEAHAMEQDVLRMLDVMISTTDDPEIVQALARTKNNKSKAADLLGIPRARLINRIKQLGLGDEDDA